MDDKSALITAGLDWTYVTTLPARAGTCREAQSLWIKERKTRQLAEQEWKKITISFQFARSVKKNNPPGKKLNPNGCPV